MQLIYLIDIFQDNYNIAIACDRFKIDVVNVMKNRAAYCKETKEISKYISLAQSIRKPLKLH